MRVFAITFTLLMLASPAATPASEDAGGSFSSADVDFFERRIRPLLADQCGRCHGVKEQEGSLRLDRRTYVLRGGDRGPAAVPGNIDDSLIVRAVRRIDDLKMPPDRPLTAQQIADITDWVKRGLPWSAEQPTTAPTRVEDHWAFQPLGTPVPPETTGRSWSRNPIDVYIERRLEDARLRPSQRATRRQRIRRASFGLRGVPPTPTEVKAFERDARPGAWERVIDRFLASPQYGERWGRHWLDVARYADNKGYVFFEEKTFPWAYTYRDYVVEAMNADLPFDTMIRHQLAADQLELGDDRRPLRALGFLTVGARFMNNLHDVLDDRIDVVTRGLLGLTVSCARCHDHKFDPIPQADYYALYGVFRSAPEPTLPPEFLPPPGTEEYAKFSAEMQKRVRTLDDFVDKTHTALVTAARTRAAEYLVAGEAARNQPSVEQFMLLTDKGALNPTMIVRWQNYLDQRATSEDAVWSIWSAFAARSPEERQLNGASIVGQLVADPDRTLNPRVKRAFEGTAPKSLEDVAKTYASVLADVDRQWQEQLKNAGSDDAPKALDDPAAEQLRQVLYGPDAPPDVPKQLGWGFLNLLPDRPTQAEFQKLRKSVEEWSRTGPGAPPRAMVVVDSPRPHRPRIFRRGNSHRLGEEVSRHFLSILSAGTPRPFARGSGRLELAEAIADPQNPLTARVFVNRVWLTHFGRGLVSTPSDFGLRSSPPSHPLLLDALSRRFVESGWSIKQLHREILTSATYQQLSDVPTNREADPENLLYGRWRPRRLDFEALRDSLLSVSGQLDRRLGGPPDDIVANWKSERRTLYGFVNRMDLPHLFRTFDFPSPAATSAQRVPTVVAPQALFLMNHPFAIACADQLAKGMAATAEAAEVANRLYARLFQRTPTKEESALIAAYWANGSQQATENGESAAWSYGWATLELPGRIKSFRHLPYYSQVGIPGGNSEPSWRGGPVLPDPELNWLLLTPTGGHPGNGLNFAVVRRWTAPRDGTVRITGQLQHHPEPGNGIRATIVVREGEPIGTWTIDQGEQTTARDGVVVSAGDTIDFVVDSHGNLTHDEFLWEVTIKMESSNTGRTTSETPTETWNSQANFAGKTQSWLPLVHAVLLTNEFVFID